MHFKSKGRFILCNHLTTISDRLGESTDWARKKSAVGSTSYHPVYFLLMTIGNAVALCSTKDKNNHFKPFAHSIQDDMDAENWTLFSFKVYLKKKESFITVRLPSVCFCFRRFLVSGLSDSRWHWVSVGASLEHLAVYVNCVLVEKVRWTFPYLGIPTDGLLMVGGIVQGFETPFEVDLLCFFVFNLWTLWPCNVYVMHWPFI